MDDKEMEELKQKIEKTNKLREMWKHVAENLDVSALSYQACERLIHKLKARMDWIDDYFRENEYWVQYFVNGENRTKPPLIQVLRREIGLTRKLWVKLYGQK